jgi:hypothetical protein
MKLKRLLGKVIPGFEKTSDVSNHEATNEEPVSPYAQYLKERDSLTEETLTGKPVVKDIFLLGEGGNKAPSTVGLYYPGKGNFLIRNPYRGGTGRIIRKRMDPAMTPLFGDWTGSRQETIGFYNGRSGHFSLWNHNEAKQAHLRFLYGLPERGWIPLVGDWSGNGKDSIGIYDPVLSIFFLRHELTAGLPDIYFKFGPFGSEGIPIAGDWDGDGIDGIGLYDPSEGTFWLRNQLSVGEPEIKLAVGHQNHPSLPVVGDWNGEGCDKVGVYDPSSSDFFLWNGLNDENSSISFHFGSKGGGGQVRPFSVRWVL